MTIIAAVLESKHGRFYWLDGAQRCCRWIARSVAMAARFVRQITTEWNRPEAAEARRRKAQQQRACAAFYELQTVAGEAEAPLRDRTPSEEMHARRVDAWGFGP